MPNLPNLLPFAPPARLAAALVAVLFLAPLLAAQACSPAGPEEDPPEVAADDGSADPAAGGLGGDELQAATPSRPDTGLDDDIETAPPDSSPDEPATAVPAGFEDTVQRGERPSEHASPTTPEEPVALTSVWIHLLSPAGDGDGDGDGEESGGGAGVTARETGEVIGCGDVVVAVAVPVEAEVSGPEDRVRVALEALFGLSRQRRGQGVPADLMNALARSSLEVDRVEPVPDRPGSYRAHLRGELRLGGVCDAPRVRAQIEGTAERAEGVEEVQVFLDGEPLDAVLSARGG